MSPDVVINSRLTELYFERSAELLHPFIKVRKCGVQSIPFAPIDELASLWGIEALMVDMVERLSLSIAPWRKLSVPISNASNS
jgi:hypothetical protein